LENQFLLKEYEFCFDQLRFYDNRQLGLMKYLLGLTSAVATAQFAIYKFLEAPTQGFFMCQSFLSFIVFVASVLLYLSMLQNRLYFVFTIKQINAIRKFLLETEAPAFKNNQLYTSTNFPSLKPFSVHTFQLIGASFISSLFSALIVYSFCSAVNEHNYISLSIVTFFFVSFVEIAGGMLYLILIGKKPADEAIHGKSE